METQTDIFVIEDDPFSHGWQLDADAWDPQMLFLVQKGYRVIAGDRRGAVKSRTALADMEPGALRKWS